MVKCLEIITPTHNGGILRQLLRRGNIPSSEVIWKLPFASSCGTSRWQVVEAGRSNVNPTPRYMTALAATLEHFNNCSSSNQEKIHPTGNLYT